MDALARETEFGGVRDIYLILPAAEARIYHSHMSRNGLRHRLKLSKASNWMVVL